MKLTVIYSRSFPINISHVTHFLEEGIYVHGKQNIKCLSPPNSESKDRTASESYIINNQKQYRST